MSSQNSAQRTLCEMREFASFEAKDHRYIRCSLDIAFKRSEPVKTWARDSFEETAINAQIRTYEKLADIKEKLSTGFDLSEIDLFMVPLVHISAFDLSRGQLTCFSSYRFLYERLFGALIRPWLPGAFCGAVALPLHNLAASAKKNLLKTLSEADVITTEWSETDPVFFPEHVEKIEQMI